MLVTCRDLYGEFQAKLCIRDAFEDSTISHTGFRAVLHVEMEGDAVALAEKTMRECFYDIGRAVPVLYEGNSTLEDLKGLAVKAALEYVGEGESFCFRLYKRGAHGLEKPTPDIEYEVGGMIHDELTKKYGKKPKVDLRSPGVTVIGEVLGSKLEVGIVRKSWGEA